MTKRIEVKIYHGTSCEEWAKIKKTKYLVPQIGLHTREAFQEGLFEFFSKYDWLEPYYEQLDDIDISNKFELNNFLDRIGAVIINDIDDPIDKNEREYDLEDVQDKILNLYDHLKAIFVSQDLEMSEGYGEEGVLLEINPKYLENADCHRNMKEYLIHEKIPLKDVKVVKKCEFSLPSNRKKAQNKIYRMFKEE